MPSETTGEAICAWMDRCTPGDGDVDCDLGPLGMIGCLTAPQLAAIAACVGVAECVDGAIQECLPEEE